MKDYEIINIELYKNLPIDQVERVFSQKDVDIGPEFLGFVNIYFHLSKTIPKHWTIVDLGCAYAPQSYYFRNHKEYIGVDIGGITERFYFKNTKHFLLSISNYIENYTQNINLLETFAICSYVPLWGNDNGLLTREKFPNCFIYYPHGGLEGFSKKQ